MSKKKAAKVATKLNSRRRRRSADEMIRDLQVQIDAVKQRAATRELKQSPSMKRTITVMRNINKALDEAADEKHTALRHALADARKPLVAFLESQGVRPPKARLPRGRRPKMG